MKIVVLGAGAIGSFFGGMLSKNHDVTLIGRKDHVQEINRNGLQIQGKTRLKRKINAVTSVKESSNIPDLLLVTVKSFDTLKAIREAKSIIQNETLVLSFQNGLGNIELINQVVPSNRIIAGITTHGIQYVKPGLIHHKGKGSTVIGSITEKNSEKVTAVTSALESSCIPTTISSDILEDIWKKAIVNASINPVTTIFKCENGYLAQNPILTQLVQLICAESTHIAQKKDYSFTVEELNELTLRVISQTKHNHSSMLQSVQQGKKTEIDQINGKFVEIGKKLGCSTHLNELLIKMVKSWL